MFLRPAMNHGYERPIVIKANRKRAARETRFAATTSAKILGLRALSTLRARRRPLLTETGVGLCVMQGKSSCKNYWAFL